jgi:hypothetical protein
MPAAPIEGGQCVERSFSGPTRHGRPRRVVTMHKPAGARGAEPRGRHTAHDDTLILRSSRGSSCQLDEKAQSHSPGRHTWARVRATGPPQAPPPGADLETKWGGADGPQPAHRTVSAAQSTRSIIRKNAEHLSSELDRTAELLEKTVAIAEQHARRRERAGDSDGGREERRAAERARKYAQRARSEAEEWRKLATRTTG